MYRVVRAWLPAVVCAVACGGTTSTADEASSPAEIQAVCKAQCERKVRCDGSTEPVDTCMDDCTEDVGGIAPHIRADFVRAFADCYSRLECDVNDDSCTGRALESIGTSVEEAENTPDIRACIAKHEQCEDTESSFSDDVCGNMAFMVTSSRNFMAGCVEKPCAEVRRCMAPILGD